MGVLFCIRGITIHNFVSAVTRFLGFILRLDEVYKEEGLEHRARTQPVYFEFSGRESVSWEKTALGET